MGGDRAPAINVRGAVEAARSLSGHEFILVGDENALREELASLRGGDAPCIRVHHASQVVEMDEPPVSALRRKRDSSILRAVSLVRQGEADAVVSAGNTGAAVAACVVGLHLLPGVQRPGIAVPFPTRTGLPCLLIDVGANIYCKPQHLFQYAVMASVYSKRILGVASPRIGILNIGEEDIKGTLLVKKTQALFNGTKLNFQGNVEGRDMFKGACDVVVCDGFVGNIVLKTSEGLAETLMKLTRKAITKNWRRRLGAALVKDAFTDLRKTTDYSEYGGAPLLGVDGICIICHGGSNDRAITNAIRVAVEHSRYQVNEQIVAELKEVNESRTLSSDPSPS